MEVVEEEKSETAETEAPTEGDEGHPTEASGGESEPDQEEEKQDHSGAEDPEQASSSSKGGKLFAPFVRRSLCFVASVWSCFVAVDLPLAVASSVASTSFFAPSCRRQAENQEANYCVLRLHR